MYSGKTCCIRAKAAVFWQGGCIRDRQFYSGKVVVFGQNWLYSGKMVVYGQEWLYSGKVVVVG